MKSIIILLVVVSILAGTLYAGTYIGGGVMHEFGVMSRNMFEGRLTFGSSLSVDVAGHLLFSNPNPAYWVQFYTYLNLNIPISNFETYVGFSPTWFFYRGIFSVRELKAHGYVHGGVALNLKPVRLYGEVSYQLIYSPISLGTVPMGTVGVQFGF